MVLQKNEKADLKVASTFDRRGGPSVRL